MAMLRKDPGSHLVAQKPQQALIIPLNKAAVSRRDLIIGAGAAAGTFLMPSFTNAGMVTNLVDAVVSIFERLEKLFQAMANFARKIGTDLQAFKSDLENMQARKAIAAAYLEPISRTPTTGVVSQRVYTMLPRVSPNDQQENELLKTINTEVVPIDPNYTTSLPIYDPLTLEEKREIHRSKKVAWIRLETAVGETDGVPA